MNGSIFSRLMKRVFAGEYAAMQREHDIDTSAFPMERPAAPSIPPLGASLVQTDSGTASHPSSVH